MQIDYTRQIMEHNGRSFMVHLEHDESHGSPWTEEDGHGPVSNWRSRESKRPWERILCEDRRSVRFYDMREATKIARRDWIDATKPKPGQRAAEAAESDFQRLRAWCNDQWHYVGVVVRPICPCCGEPIDSAAQSLWGIESDAGDYLEEVARELADQCDAPECCKEEAEA